MNTEQKLGIKVFYYYLSKRLLIGVLLLIVSFIFLSFKGAIVSKIAFLFSVKLALAIISSFIFILFTASVILIIGGLFMSWMDYISCVFTLDEASFNIRRGIFNKREVSIPYRQIQDINIEQTFNHRMMGVSKLIILTAGNDDKGKEGGSEGIFEVIDSRVAKDVRKSILQKTSIETVTEVKTPNTILTS